MAEILSTLSADGLKGTPTNGGARYQSISAWESAQQGVHTLADNSRLEAYRDNYTGGGEADGYVGNATVRSWVTAVDSTITIGPAPGHEHDGTEGSGFYWTSNAPNSPTLEARQSFLTVSDISMSNNDTGGDQSRPVFIRAVETTIERCVISVPVGNIAQAIGTDTNSMRIKSNLLISHEATGVGLAASFTPCTFINNTIICTPAGRDKYGILTVNSDGPTDIINNTIFCGGATEVDFTIPGASVASTNNQSSDNSAVSTGIGTVTGIALTDGVDFVAPSTGDYNAQLGGKLDSAGTNSILPLDDVVSFPFADPPSCGAFEITYQFDGPDIIDQTGDEEQVFNFNEDGNGDVDSRFSTPGGTYSLAPGSDALPIGLTIDAATGNVIGTPDAGQAGTYTNIIIQGDDGLVTAIFSVLLQSSLIPEIATGSPTPTFTRTSEATVVDYKGIVRTVADGVPRFLGARLDPDNVTYHTTRDDGTTPIDATDSYADADGPYGYMSESSATNLQLYSNDLTKSTWGSYKPATIAKDAIGLDGEANSACTVTDSNAAAIDFARSSNIGIPDDDATHMYRVYIKKDEDETRFVRLDFYLLIGTLQGIGVQLNTKTGALNELTVLGNASSSAELVGDFWKIDLVAQNNSSGNDITYTQISPANSTTWGTAEDSATGSCIVGNTELYLDTSFAGSTIFTEASTVTRAADSLTYPDIGNIEDAAGTAKANSSTFWDIAENEAHVLARDISGRMLSSALADPDTTIKVYDGVNTAVSPAGANMNGAPQDLKSDWGVDMAAYINAAGGTPVAYDGTIGVGIIGVGARGDATKQWNGTIRKLEIFNVEGQ